MAGSGIKRASAQSVKRPPDSTKTWQRPMCAMPDGHNGIRVHFDEDEPPAVIFNEQALPGAFVSWACSELMALNSLLDAFTATRHRSIGDPDIAGAVQATLMPVINALRFSERRAHELRLDVSASRPRRGKKSAKR